MSLSEYKYLVSSDLYRLQGRIGFWPLLVELLSGEGFKYVFWMRTCAFLHSRPIFRASLYFPARLILLHYTYKFGISIPPSTQIGSGFCIGHFGGIVVNGSARIGRNCELSHGVTIGQANRGARRGYATVGNNVYFGPGSKVVGAVVIGDNVAVGANCVVTKNVPDNAVVVGVPGRVISFQGSKDYVNRTDYPLRNDIGASLNSNKE